MCLSFSFLPLYSLPNFSVKASDHSKDTQSPVTAGNTLENNNYNSKIFPFSQDTINSFIESQIHLHFAVIAKLFTVFQ